MAGNRDVRFRTALGVIAGGVVAAAVGYGLSAALASLGLALITASEEAGSSAGGFFARAGLNFYAIQHIRIVGGGEGGSSVSILWPVTMWSAFSVLGLLFGGFVSAVLSRSEGTNRAWAGAWIAIPYVILLLIARMFIAVPSGSISLPEIGGVAIAPEAVPVLLTPDLWGTVFYGAVFGVAFGAIGGIGFVKAARSLFRRRGVFWPAWVRGALVALIVGQLAFLLLTALATVGGFGAGQGEEYDGVQAKAWATLVPAASGAIHYLSHGVTLRGNITVRPGLPEARPVVQTYSAGLFSGIVSEGERRPVPGWAFLSVLIPAVALVYGGVVAAKTANEPTTKARLAAGLAGIYALLLTALVAFYTLAVRTVISAGDVTTSTVAVIGPSAAQSFALGLVLGFVFALIGISIYRPHADI